MDNIPVVWFSEHSDTKAKGFWDQCFLEEIFSHELWKPICPFTFEDHSVESFLKTGCNYCIIVIPSRWHVERVDSINAIISDLDWVIVILTGDEEGVFPWRELSNENMLVWVQTPHEDRHADAHRRVGDWYRQGTRETLRALEPPQRQEEWFFSGQINNTAREDCGNCLRSTNLRGKLNTTDTFGSGLEQEEYLKRMSICRIAPSPSGSYTPDTFRFYEALEAGAIPVVNRRAPQHPDHLYWDFLFEGQDFPIHAVGRWSEFRDVFKELNRGYDKRASIIQSKWIQYKRRVAHWMHDDIAHFISKPEPSIPDDSITVVMPTSPVPSHPSIDGILETIGSIRSALPYAEILILCDGVRKEQRDRLTQYYEYLRALLWETNLHQVNICPFVFADHMHQSLMTKAVLDEVRTPYVLFVEHDTPLVGDIDWGFILQAMPDLNLLRFYHETVMQKEHWHLMVDKETYLINDVPVVRTMQWSQRPHLAKVDFYKHIMSTYFGLEGKTMIEDTMHGVLEHQLRTGGPGAWDAWRTAIYYPEGNVQRSGHLDLRADDPKFPMEYQYDGPTPPGAPNPSRSR